jgi:hypothetical protein
MHLLGQRGVLDDDDAVVADGRSNVSRTAAFQHVNVAGHFRDLPLNFAEILVLSADQAAGKQTGSQENPQFASVVSQLHFDFATG